MQYNISSLLVNGVWRTLLVVISDTPIDYTGVDMIERRQDNGDTITTTRWYTDGLYRSIEQDGKYYYWFLVMRTEEEIADNPSYWRGEAEELLGLLGQAAELEYDNALEEIESV